MMAPSPLQPEDPARVGGYRLLGRLGFGGQGAVYLGEAPNGQRVAVKMLHADLSRDGWAREQFLGEVAATQRVRQFCTARVLDISINNDRPYIVSEYVDGPSLSDLVRHEGPRDPATLERLAVATITAIAAIHQAGIVHRDFKPSNVMCGPDGPRVIDFGIARALDVTTTQTNQPVGTPAYMSPEQVSMHRVGPASDVFSWAATMLYAATGTSPFGLDTVLATFHRILNVDPDVTALTDPLRSIVAACLAKDAGKRPTATGVLLTLLGHDGPVAEGMGGVATGAGTAERAEDEVAGLLALGAEAAADPHGLSVAYRTGFAVRIRPSDTTADPNTAAGARQPPPGLPSAPRVRRRSPSVRRALIAVGAAAAFAVSYTTAALRGSDPVAQVRVPSAMGLPHEAACQLIDNARLACVAQSDPRPVTDANKIDIVSGQDPAPGTATSNGEVTVVYPDTFTMPSVISQTQGQACAQLRRYKARCQAVPAGPVAGARPGQVYTQIPAAGTVLRMAAATRVLYYAGDAVVGAYVGKGVDDACTQVEAAGFACQTREGDTAADTGRQSRVVYQQVPSPNTVRDVRRPVVLIYHSA